VSNVRRRLGFGRERPKKLPNEREWERAERLDAVPAARLPELISDGAGLPFSPAALAAPPAPLDPGDPAAAALLAHLRQLALRGPRDAPPPSLDGWRTLARVADEALFGLGRPPALVTVTTRLDVKRRTWSATSGSSERPPRATRDGIRASAWRVDPEHAIDPSESVLRILVTEQSFAGGQPARGRGLAPEVHLGADELVMRIFVTPRPGFQPGARNPETPVLVALPEPVGGRRLLDGAVLLR
jgi:hypothetical protein